MNCLYSRGILSLITRSGQAEIGERSLCLYLYFNHGDEGYAVWLAKNMRTLRQYLCDQGV